MKTEEVSDHQVEQNKTVERLKNKAIEAFLLAIEIYNKPTITRKTSTHIRSLRLTFYSKC